MASLPIRSSRRTKGLSTRSAMMNNVAASKGNHHDYNTTEHAHLGRRKRSRESLEDAKQLLSTKRARIAIEIDSRPKAIPQTRSLVIKANATHTHDTIVSPHHKQQQPAKGLRTVKPQPAPQPAPNKPINHQDKVANGIKHELDRLQPAEADLKGATRKLRSDGGTRFKSELSQYFPEYDEVIGNEPKEDHILNIDTPIIIVDGSIKAPVKQPPSPRKTDGHAHIYPLKEFPDSLFYDLHDSHKVNFSFMDKNYKEEGGEDPLPDEYFKAMHKKPERQEKSIRNTDRGRAQHEKDQVIRLLEGLQGHDWLKLMGVSGITDSKKKDYEPARAHFIKGCEQIIEKFRIWRDEEKRRKLEREQAMAEVEEEEGDDEVDEDAEEDEGVEVEAADYYGDDEDGNISDGDPPDYSDIDASAARQLHEEAIARSKSSSVRSTRRTKFTPNPTLACEIPKEEKEFKSFFSKPYLRAAALGKHRRSGRSSAAWGHPIPEVPEQEFDLPEEFRDDDTLKAHARRRRRDRRVSKN